MSINQTQSILSALPLPMMVARRADNQILFVNKQFAQLLETDPADLTGQINPGGFIDPADRQDLFRLLAEQGFVNEAEVRLMSRGGHEIWVLFSVHPIAYEEDAALLLSMTEITKQKQTEIMLAQRAREMETVSKVSAFATSILQIDELLQSIVDLTKEQFSLYHAHIYLLDKQGTQLKLASGAGNIGRQMVAEERIIPLAQEQSLVAQAARTGQGVIENDVNSNPAFLQHPLLPNTKAEMAVPMLVGEQLIGVLDVQADQIDYFTQESIEVQTTLAAQIGVAIQNAHSFEQNLKLFTEAEALLEITHKASHFLELDNILDEVLDKVLAATGFKIGLISIFNPQAEQLQLAAHRLPEPMVQSIVQGGLKGSLCDLVYNRKEAIVLTDLTQDAPVDVTGLIESGYHSYQGVPLESSGEVLGTLCLFHTDRLAKEDANPSFLTAIGQQIGNALQNSNLFQQAQLATQEAQQSEEVLRRSEAELSQALEIAKLGYWEFDVANDLFTFNDQFYAIFHTTAEAHGGYQLSSGYYAENFVYPDDMALVGGEIGLALNSTDQHYTRQLEHRILYADGGVGYISVNFNVERDEQGNILRFYGANQDITERKVAEEAMRRLTYAVDQSLDGTAVADLDGNLTFVNPAWAQMHGYTVAELIGSHLSIFHSPEQLEHEVAPANAHVMKTGESFQAEIGHMRKDGTLFPTLMSIGVLHDANGNPIGLSAACQDITERKAAELQLRENQERLAESNRISKLYPWEFDLATQMFTFIPEYFEFLGSSEKENGGLLISAQDYATKFVPPEEAAIVANEIGQAIATKDPNYSRNVETYNMTVDGRIIPVLVRFRIEKDQDGNTVKIIGANQDISEQKAAEEELRRSESELSQALEIAKLGYWEFDVANDLFHFNDQFYSLFHTTAKAHGGYQLSSGYYAENFVYPDDLGIVGEEIGKALNSTDRHYSRLIEHRILYADGGVGYITVNVNVERDEEGNLLRFYGANQDITDRKLAEEELRRSESELSQALEIAKLGYWEFDVANDLFTFNDQFYALFHTTAKAHGGYKISSAYYAQHFVYPDDMPLVGSEIEKALTSTDRYYTRLLEHRILYADGGVGYITVNVNVERDEEGNLLRFYGANQDISERKAAENKLQESQARLAEANRISKLYPWEFDLATQMFTFISEYFEFLGSSEKENGGLLISAQDYATKFVPPEEAAIVANEIGQAIATKDPNYSRNVETYNMTADGRIIPVLVRFRIEKDQEGNTIKIIGANQDISEQRAAEEELRRSEAELSEALKIAKLGYWEFDVANDLFHFNDQFYSLFHTTAEAHGGYQLASGYYAQNFVYPDDMPLVGNEIGLALNSTEKHYNRLIEHRILYADGGIGYASVNVNVERDDEGNVLRFYGANQDITERKLAEEAIAKQARELQIVAELATAVATTLEQQKLLQEVVDLTKERFDLYHAHIYLMNAQGDALVLASGAGEVGRQLVQQKHVIHLDSAQSLVAQAALTGTAVVVNNVRENPNWLPNKLLPETQAEMAIPMAVGGRVIGVLDVQANQIDWFTAQDIQIQTTLAAQVSIALENARSFERAQTAIAEMNALTRRLTQEAWTDYSARSSDKSLRYLFDGQVLHEVPDSLETAVTQTTDTSIIQPIEINGVPIGKLAAVPEDLADEDDVEEIVESVMRQLGAHIENLRLIEETQVALGETEALYIGSEKLVLSDTENDVLQALIQSTIMKNMDRANILLFEEPVEDGIPTTAMVSAVWSAEGEPPSLPVGAKFQASDVPLMSLISPTNSLVIENVHEDTRFDDRMRQFLTQFAMTSVIQFPLTVGNQWIGWVSAHSREIMHLDEHQTRRINSLVKQAAVVLQTTMLFRQEQARARREQMLREITAKVRSSVDVDTVMRTAVMEIGRTLGRRAFIKLGNGQPDSNPEQNGAT